MLTTFEINEFLRVNPSLTDQMTLADVIAHIKSPFSYDCAKCGGNATCTEVNNTVTIYQPCDLCSGIGKTAVNYVANNGVTGYTPTP